ncbi:methyl-accepting chemotaxis protein McpA [Clostridium ragsdalei P11]|uniref:Methyl-accepting chemotaxis protein McpA n=1 Tax=Clostridium ragsdalei P11 TaxID=1353534 RepID=A0A1A6B2B5_9CLOT|nr:methyl-accepting chemotaxis protein [Clostridium ragsdalei]OBR96427.1 methyl-accepting chemotaxis protein McpA [Clostridium ragsdalei P11]
MQDANKLKDSVKFKILAVPAAIIFIVITIIACVSIGIARNKILLQTKTDGMSIANEIGAELERNNNSIDELNNSIDTRIRTLGSFLVNNSDKINNDYLTSIAKQFDVDEINSTDPSGKVIYSNLTSSINFVFDSKTDSYKVLKGNKDISIENIRKSAESNNYYKYGSIRKSDGGIIQIGILANKVQKLTSSLETQNVLENIVKDKSIVYALFVNKNLKIIAHSDKSRVGMTVHDIGSKTAAVDGKTYFSEYKYKGKIPVYDILIPIAKNGITIGAVDVGMSMENVHKTVYTTIAIIIILSLMCFTVAVIILIKISKGITSPLEELVTAAKKIENGDLDSKITVNSKGEIGVLARSFKNMSESLKNTIGSIRENSINIRSMSDDLNTSAEHMTGAANEVANAIQEVAKGTTQQSQDLIFVSNVVDKFEKEFENISGKLSNVNDSSKITRSKADNGKEQVKLLLQSIGDVKTSFEKVTGKIDSLNDSVSKVGNITEVINDISEQTNLLALNAAIEASRAGEAGKGFSVVAEEVRLLAEQSKESTGQIQSLVKSISIETKEVMSTSNKVKNLVENQTVIVDKTINSFEEMTSSIQTIRPLVKDVNESLESTNNSKNDIVGKVEAVTAVSEETSASSEEIAASSEEMLASSESVAKLSEQLEEMVDKFNEQISKFKC